MSAENKVKYQGFCKRLDNIPIFSQGWWLDVVCGPDKWDVAISEKGGEVLGAWPYYKINKFGQQMLVMPPLTKFLGIYINYPNLANSYAKGSYEKKIIAGLLEQIPYKHLDQNFHYSFKNWLPLYWAGFSQKTLYSYCLQPSNIGNLSEGLKPSIKRGLKKAERHLHVVVSDAPEQMHNLVKKTYHAKNKPAPFTLELFKKLSSACNERQCGKILLAVDEKNNVHAGIYLVWDTQSCYYLIGGTDPDFKGSNASTLLLWTGIQEAFQAGRSFDFEGSIVESIERYFRSFGADQKPYFNLKHSSSKWLKTYFFFKNL